MGCFYRYKTPEDFDDLIMCSDGKALTGLWFERLPYSEKRLAVLEEIMDFVSLPPVFRDTCRWLDVYFAGMQPDFMPVFRIDNLTPFRKAVLDKVCEIPFGRTLTYGEIAKMLKINSAQAVGGAVGWNPICIIVPCHRVVGADGCLVGYGGGIRNKTALLRLEGILLS